MLSREHGVITRVLLGGSLQVSPPLVITREELDEMTAGFAAALDACVAVAA
jgi:adenosylmethionine-8-amino-7-oxononanoate aminotransferase